MYTKRTLTVLIATPTATTSAFMSTMPRHGAHIVQVVIHPCLRLCLASPHPRQFRQQLTSTSLR